ncbi:MAG: hypothetical protein QXF56_05020 [Candidatus Micrarchaeia archaeon]
MNRIYKKLLRHFGKQHWWPTTSNNPQFEIIVGAFLTQQSTWRNVEKAIENLKNEKMLTSKAIAEASLTKLYACVKPTGFYRQKARRLRKFAKYIEKTYNGNLKLLLSKPLEEAREELLSLEGVGYETADSILLYAAEKLIFPIDAYTKRICERLGVVKGNYNKLQNFFHSNLPRNLEVYKEMHALLVELGKNYCKTKPNCPPCPLRKECTFYIQKTKIQP